MLAGAKIGSQKPMLQLHTDTLVFSLRRAALGLLSIVLAARGLSIFVN